MLVTGEREVTLAELLGKILRRKGSGTVRQVAARKSVKLFSGSGLTRRDLRLSTS